MLFKDFKERCRSEYYRKNPDVRKTDFRCHEFLFIGTIAGTLGKIYPDVTLGRFIFNLIGVWIFNYIIFSLYYHHIYKEANIIIKQYKKSGAYLNIPENYPYSILYPGEVFPFDRTDVEPLDSTQLVNLNPVAAPMPSLSSPAVNPQSVVNPQPVIPPQPVVNTEPVQQPEKTKIFCQQCGKPLLIPAKNKPVSVTCPKCGSTFIHRP